MLVLGIDPGSHRLGWAIVRKTGTRLQHVAHGVIHAKDALLGDRLVTIERELVAIVRDHHPDQASIESIFFHKDAQAAAKLGHARGVALLVCARAGLVVAEYPPARVKRTVTGHGRAEKSQVAMMMRALLGLPAPPAYDAADAMAIAVTHLQSSVPAALKRRSMVLGRIPSNGTRK